MPLINEAYWRARFDSRSTCWSGDRWLDWEHGIVARHAIRRVWPRDVRVPARRLLDVGCGDGRFTVWMARTFHVMYHGVDGLRYPGQVLASALSVGDAERLSDIPELGPPHPVYGKYVPDLITFVSSLAYMSDWRKAVSEAVKLSDRILVFENLQTPTPPWLKGLSHRKHMTILELGQEFVRHGFVVERAVAADVLHRRLFLVTPAWSHALVAGLSVVGDLLAAHLLRPLQARHSAVLFVKRPRPTFEPDPSRYGPFQEEDPP